MRRLFLFGLLQFFSLSAMAFEESAYIKSLEGHFVQGGFITGEVVPYATIKIGVYETMSDENGIFYIGIPRLAKKENTLKISVLNADAFEMPISIQENDYQTQYVKGVKAKHVTPKTEEDWARIQQDKKRIHQARTKTAPLPYIQHEFSYPVSGTITGVYGSRRFYNGEERSWHKGYDFAGKTGTEIQAPQGGIVRLALADSYFNGNLVMVEHGYGMTTLYAHLDSISVEDGQTVEKGDILGTLGSTGRSTGPHLHWGLYWGKMALNPMLLFKQKEQLR
jgi:murein DD-endopeptidase MepM/ murein hydrolase activator NlpD